MRYAEIGESFSDEIRFSTKEISDFARRCGDLNPLHHDAEFARQTRFGGIIASGPQTAAQFMGITATYFSKKGAALGLDFHIQFKKAAYPDEILHSEWTVVSVEWKEKLSGEIVRLEGQMTNPKGEVVLAGTGAILITEKL